MDSIRRQIGNYLAAVARSTPGNVGGASYGQPFDFSERDLPYDWVFVGPERFDNPFNGRVQSNARFVVTRLFRYGGERGSLYDVGERHVAELVRYYNSDQAERDTNPSDLQFWITLEAVTLQAVPEDSTTGAASSYGAVNLAMNVMYQFMWTDPYSQQVV